MPIRSKNSYQVWLDDFISEILVECPGCSRQSFARKVKSEKYNWTTAMKLTCSHCGFNKVYETSRLPAPAWLSIECAGHYIWALNHLHLEALKQHVEAFLRERNGVPRANASIGSRLPRWMTSKNNRNKVLKCIEKLQQKKSG